MNDISHLPTQRSSWSQHWAHLGPVGPKWAPCWPHEPCYQGCHYMNRCCPRSVSPYGMAWPQCVTRIYISKQLIIGISCILWPFHFRSYFSLHIVQLCSKSVHAFSFWLLGMYSFQSPLVTLVNYICIAITFILSAWYVRGESMSN